LASGVTTVKLTDFVFSMM